MQTNVVPFRVRRISSHSLARLNERLPWMESKKAVDRMGMRAATRRELIRLWNINNNELIHHTHDKNESTDYPMGRYRNDCISYQNAMVINQGMC